MKKISIMVSMKTVYGGLVNWEQHKSFMLHIILLCWFLQGHCGFMWFYEFMALLCLAFVCNTVRVRNRNNFDFRQ